MCKRISRVMAFLLAFVLVLTTAVATPAYAAEPASTDNGVATEAVEPRVGSISPQLTISDDVANMSVTAYSGNTSDELTAVIKLYRGSACIGYWEAEGNGYIIWSKSKSATEGYTYKLQVTLTVNGTTYSPVSVSKSY